MLFMSASPLVVSNHTQKILVGIKNDDFAVIYQLLIRYVAVVGFDGTEKK